MEEDESRPGEGGGIFIYAAVMAVVYLMIIFFLIR